MTYYHPGHLSNRLESDASGAQTRTFGHLPFGDTWYATGTTDKWQFTTYERDGESALDYAVYRSYTSRLGRFLTADPFAGSVETTDPQTWNRYAYITNNPIIATDPLGLCPRGYHPLSAEQRAALVAAASPKNWLGWTFGMPSNLSQKQIDCSTFVYLSAKNAGITIPYTQATDLSDSVTYAPVSAANLRSGNIIQFQTPGGTHMAIATSSGTSWDFAGSQTSTGPAVVKNWTSNPYWNGDRYAQTPSLGAVPIGYFEMCVPDTPARTTTTAAAGSSGAGGGGGSNGSFDLGHWFYYGGVSSEGTFQVGAWVWVPGPSGHAPLLDIYSGL